MGTRFENAIVITLGSRNAVLWDSAVVVEGEKITAIGSTVEMRKLSPQAEVVDCAGKLIMPTGAVGIETGPKYHQAIANRGFTPVLGMSAPLQLVIDRKKPGDPDTISEALISFKMAGTPPARWTSSMCHLPAGLTLQMWGTRSATRLMRSSE